MSDRHDSLDRGVRVIALEPEVVVAEIENIPDFVTQKITKI